MISVAAGAGLALLPPLVLGRLIDNQLAMGQVQGILALALAYLGATVAGHLTGFLTAYSASVAAQAALRRLRVRVFDHLQKMPIAYYDHTPVGDTISRCTTDMETIDRLYGVTMEEPGISRVVTVKFTDENHDEARQAG